MLGSLKSKIDSMVQGSAGRNFRWLATTGLGLVSSAAGAALGIAERYIIENIFDAPGPVMFINNLYPSIVK